jgi:hypothetical protein
MTEQMQTVAQNAIAALTSNFKSMGAQVMALNAQYAAADKPMYRKGCSVTNQADADIMITNGATVLKAFLGPDQIPATYKPHVTGFKHIILCLKPDSTDLSKGIAAGRQLKETVALCNTLDPDIYEVVWQQEPENVNKKISSALFGSGARTYQVAINKAHPDLDFNGCFMTYTADHRTLGINAWLQASHDAGVIYDKILWDNYSTVGGASVKEGMAPDIAIARALYGFNVPQGIAECGIKGPDGISKAQWFTELGQYAKNEQLIDICVFNEGDYLITANNASSLAAYKTL